MHDGWTKTLRKGLAPPLLPLLLLPLPMKVIPALSKRAVLRAGSSRGSGMEFASASARNAHVTARATMHVGPRANVEPRPVPSVFVEAVAYAAGWTLALSNNALSLPGLRPPGHRTIAPPSTTEEESYQDGKRGPRAMSRILRTGWSWPRTLMSSSSGRMILRWAGVAPACDGSVSGARAGGSAPVERRFVQTVEGISALRVARCRNTVRRAWSKITVNNPMCCSPLAMKGVSPWPPRASLCHLQLLLLRLMRFGFAP